MCLTLPQVNPTRHSIIINFTRSVMNTIQITDRNGNSTAVPVKDIHIVENPYSPGEHLSRHDGECLNLSDTQKQLVWEDRQPDAAPFVNAQASRPLIMGAKLAEGLFLNYVNDGTADTFYGAIVLVKNGVQFELVNRLPEGACLVVFHNLIDAWKARGDSPVVTYCSFD